ncbi:MAG: choice-of-anchor D domain-containing protein [Acidobacteriaceae bacterium]|nr:choice-of-anchor D domain-containing protein [Acidobacteriaceae bacterium]
MNRLLCCLVLAALPVASQTLSFSIQGSSTTLGTTYSFPDTAQSSSSSIQVNVKNTGTVPVGIIDVYATVNSSFSAQNPNFTVTGFDLNSTLAPGASEPFTVNFTPTTAGALTGYLQVAYFVEQGGCSFSNSQSSGCTASILNATTLQGKGTAPAIVVSYSNNGTNTVLQPNATAPLNFGNVSLSSTAPITFTVSNQSSSTVSTPDVTLQVEIYNSSAFQLDKSALPATLGAGASANFTVTFAPGQIGVDTATLNVGSSSFPLQGAGVAVTDLDALQISYVDQTGVRTEPQAATPIDFGQIVAGTNATATLTFTVTNPTTSFSAVTLPSLTVSGAGFSMTGAPTLPAAIQPGASITFEVTFAPAATGPFTGSLSIGSRVFALSGQTTTPATPSVSFELSATPLLSGQQVNLTIQSASAAQVDAIGDLTLQFKPSLANVSDDPAIVFLATNTRELQVTLAAGSQSATFNHQSAIAFQTGTTAGTITFTLTFPDAPPYSQSYTISPAQIFVTSAQAVTESPNLVVTLDGYDNTYSAGELSFLFYDKSGKQISPSALQVDATTNFHNYFFTNNQAGGAFSMQASFPVTGDATQVGSVAVTLANSAGQTTKKLTFQ